MRDVSPETVILDRGFTGIDYFYRLRLLRRTSGGAPKLLAEDEACSALLLSDV